ncbi:MAG: hypothetical protein SFX73_02445 [Kofleriaceae bacterium]|nr:hypothetical protein [Kofleriaceae bacterium]
MRKPHVPQNLKLGGTSLPQDGQRRMPVAAAAAGTGAGTGAEAGAP